MNMRHIFTVLALSLAFFASEIYADIPRSSWTSPSYSSNSDTQAYVGVAFGKVSHDYTGFEEPTSIELLIGLEVNENIAIEGSYLNPADAGDNLPPEWTISISGFTIGAVGKHNITPEFELQGKVGLFFWDFEVSEDGFGTFYENDGTDLFYGIGGMFSVTENVSLGLHYNFYEADDDDFDILQAQVQIAFQ